MLLRLMLTATLLAFAGGVQATVFDLPDDGGDIIGKTLHIQTRYEDTFVALAQKYDVGFEELIQANPGVDPWLPGDGTDVVIPRQYILPDAPHKGIVVNLAEMRLYFFPRDSSEYAGKVFTFPLSIGRQGWTTPLGTTSVVRKKADPAWHPPASIRKEHAEHGDPLPAVVPAGPDNPLGQHALYLGFSSYLIHGTNKPAGIGLRSSHGCLRMFPADISSLFSMVPVNTQVTIVNQPYKFGWQDNELYMEAHPPDAVGREKVRSYTPWVEALIKATKDQPDTPVDWDEAQALAKQASGIPATVGKAPETARTDQEGQTNQADAPD